MGLEDGWWTVRAWVQSGGDRTRSQIGIDDLAGETRWATLPMLRADQWVQITVSGFIKSRRCAIRLCSDADAGGWAGFDDIELVPGRAALSILGADLSSLKKSEDRGGIYRYEDGTPADALKILKDHGMNFVRLKVWVNPADGYNNPAKMLEMARRVKQMELGLLVDFHYSDTWADPAKQFKPAAWKDFDSSHLARAVYEHTFEVCRALSAQATPADIVQIGNEIHNGMLWPEGSTEHWDTLAALLKVGFRAVKNGSASSRVMLHLAEGGKNALFREWFDHAVERGVSYDLIGASYYPFWHGTLQDLQANLFDISARYGKEVVVVETAYGFTAAEKDAQKNILREPVEGYALTPQGQAAFLRDVMNVVRAVPHGRGTGIFYWEPAWTVVPGNGWDPANPDSGNEWENQALFDYDDRALPAMGVFLNP
jgi:arabinogalactan endo-1,4-beta-galactosidase